MPFRFPTSGCSHLFATRGGFVAVLEYRNTPSYPGEPKRQDIKKSGKFLRLIFPISVNSMLPIFLADPLFP